MLIAGQAITEQFAFVALDSLEILIQFVKNVSLT